MWMAHHGEGVAKEDVDGGSKTRSEEVQLIYIFGSRWIKMEKQNSYSQPQHSWDKALMMMMIVIDEYFQILLKY